MIGLQATAIFVCVYFPNAVIIKNRHIFIFIQRDKGDFRQKTEFSSFLGKAIHRPWKMIRGGYPHLGHTDSLHVPLWYPCPTPQAAFQVRLGFSRSYVQREKSQ